MPFQHALNFSRFRVPDPQSAVAAGREKAFENICRLKPTVEPGSKFIYSDVNYIVLGELAPKSLALQRSEGTALWVVRPLTVFLWLLRPAIFVLNGLGNLVLRLCGLQPGTG